MITVTCDNCGKKVCEADMKDGTVRIKCQKCGSVKEYSIKPEVKPAGFLVRIIEGERRRTGSPEA